MIWVVVRFFELGNATVIPRSGLVRGWVVTRIRGVADTEACECPNSARTATTSEVAMCAVFGIVTMVAGRPPIEVNALVRTDSWSPFTSWTSESGSPARASVART